MPLVRIVKRYNSLSSKHGIVETDKVRFPDANAAARFVTSVNSNPRIDYEIIDYDVVLAHVSEGPEILENPTGGYVGKIK